LWDKTPQKKGNEKMPTTNSLQDVISALKSDRSADTSALLHVANMIVAYYNRPAHEITIKDMKQGRRYFPLFLSFRRIPLNEVDPIVEHADLLLARAARMHRAEFQVSNCIPQDSSAHAHPTAGAESISMSVAL
jgi:hypothetical protein